MRVVDKKDFLQAARELADALPNIEEFIKRDFIEAIEKDSYSESYFDPKVKKEELIQFKTDIENTISDKKSEGKLEFFELCGFDGDLIGYVSLDNTHLIKIILKESIDNSRDYMDTDKSQYMGYEFKVKKVWLSIGNLSDYNIFENEEDIKNGYIPWQKVKQNEK